MARQQRPQAQPRRAAAAAAARTLPPSSAGERMRWSQPRRRARHSLLRRHACRARRRRWAPGRHACAQVVPTGWQCAHVSPAAALSCVWGTTDVVGGCAQAAAAAPVLWCAGRSGQRSAKSLASRAPRRPGVGCWPPGETPDGGPRRAQAARATRARLSLAFGRPQPEPARAAAHWDLLLQEARWLQQDFAQARPTPRRGGRRGALGAGRAQWQPLPGRAADAGLALLRCGASLRQGLHCIPCVPMHGWLSQWQAAWAAATTSHRPVPGLSGPAPGQAGQWLPAGCLRGQVHSRARRTRRSGCGSGRLQRRWRMRPPQLRCGAGCARRRWPRTSVGAPQPRRREP